jgi:thiol-disulfide isomerase/thioredoxin
MHAKGKKEKSEKYVEVSQKDEGISKIRIGIAVAILIVLVLVIIFYNDIFPSTDVVAVVNGEKITAKEFSTLYARIPSLYKDAGLTEMKFLNDTLIPQKILLQEAAKQSITVTDSEIEEMIASIISMSGITKEDLESQLKQQNMTYEDFKQMSKEQLIITKLLNATVPIMKVTDQEAKDFYNSNKDLFATSNTTFTKFEEVKAKIIEYLANQKFMEQVRGDAEVQIFLLGGSETASLGSLQKQDSFIVSSDEICTENGRPLVILFSTTTCPHCKWIKGTFDSVAKEYMDAGKITAYHWELDTGDDTLTSAKESGAPSSQFNMFKRYSTSGGVPTFVFGCKYYRIGNGYESSKDLVAEELEFRKIIESLIAG